MPPIIKSVKPRALVAGLCLAGAFLSGCSRDATGDAVADSVSFAPDKMEWTSVSEAYQRATVDSDYAGALLEHSQSTHSQPARYVSALLEVRQGRLQAGLESFTTLNVGEIPASFLYIPFRLHEELRPGESNPFWNELRSNINQSGVEQLIRARVLILDGQLLEGLEAYGRTDPSVWTRFDANLLTDLSHHAGLGGDCRRLLRAALRGGRVPADLRDLLLRTLYPVEDTFGSAASMELLRERLAGQPEVAEAVAGAARSLLDLQRLFLERDYQTIRDRCIGLDPVGQADRTVLLAYLASASLPDKAEASRWSSELLRRYPNSEMKEWIQAIRKEME